MNFLPSTINSWDRGKFRNVSFPLSVSNTFQCFETGETVCFATGLSFSSCRKTYMYMHICTYMYMQYIYIAVYILQFLQKALIKTNVCHSYFHFCSKTCWSRLAEQEKSSEKVLCSFSWLLRFYNVFCEGEPTFWFSVCACADSSVTWRQQWART